MLQGVLGLPIWFLFLAAIVLMYAGFEAGHYFCTRRHENTASKDELGSLVGAMLGLLSFILAITFGGQVSRFDDQKQLVVREATQIQET